MDSFPFVDENTIPDDTQVYQQTRNRMVREDDCDLEDASFLPDLMPFYNDLPSYSRPTSLPQPGPRSRYRHNPLRHRKRTSKPKDFTIYEDEQLEATPSRGSTSFFGSNVPALGEQENCSDFHYGAIHEMVKDIDRDPWLYELSPSCADLLKLREQYEMTLEQRVTDRYKWSCLEDPMDVWKWVEDRGYNRNWSNAQKRGFVKLRKAMGDAIKANSRIYRQGGAHPENAFDAYFLRAIDDLGITDISVRNVRRYFYHFTPIGDNKPMFRLSDFNEIDQWRIHRNACYREHWLPGEMPDDILEVAEDPSTFRHHRFYIVSEAERESQRRDANMTMAVENFKLEEIEDRSPGVSGMN